MIRPTIRRRTVPTDAIPLDGLHPVTQRVLAARGVRTPDDIDVSLGGLADVTLLGGIGQAVTLLAAAVEDGERILVIGDFDADGATSTALALRALTAMGASNVGYLVPNRFEFGYGLTPEIVALAAQQKPHLIVTVDNGVSSVAGVAAAHERGIRVLVTDHHLPGAELPAADAMVNPNLDGDGFPSKALAGVGVIFYVMAALRARLRERGWFQRPGMREPNLAELLDLVALGTVADVVPLDDNNRRLVAQGLKRIRSGNCLPGISALINVAGRNRARLGASDLGFAIGPRLNAAGRLADMSLGIECLLSDRPARCATIATQLDELNRERRDIEQAMREEAFAIVADLLPDNDGIPPDAITVHDADWHQGVIGIVAARVKDRFHRPVVAFATADDGRLKGSARSIPGVHIRDALDAIAARHPEIISHFGGHAMAAGLTIEADRLAAFERAFADVVGDMLSAEVRDKLLLSDGMLMPDDFSLALARELADCAPWGQGFPEPRFDGRFHVEDRRVVGTDHLRLVLRAADGDNTVAAIAFGAADEPWARDAGTIDAYYKLDVNDYRGVDTLQLVVEYAEAVT